MEHLGYDEASMEAGGREFDPRPGHCSRMSFYFLVQPGNWYVFFECAFLSKF